MFPGAGKSHLARIAIYVRLVFYLRETESGPWPRFFIKKRLPRFIYVAVNNTTVDNCTFEFIRLVEKLDSVYPASFILPLVARKYAKSFTKYLIDQRLIEYSNKNVKEDGQIEFDIQKVFFFFFNFLF